MQIRHYIIYFGFTFYLCNLMPLYAHGWLTTVEKIMFCWHNIFLKKHPTLSPEYEQFCRSILRRANVDDADSVIIYEKKDSPQALPGRFLGIDENWLKRATFKEKEYAIFYQAYRLASHYSIRQIVVCVGLGILNLAIFAPLSEAYIFKYVPWKGVYVRSLFHSFVAAATMGSPFLKLLYKMELEAHLYAVKMAKLHQRSDIKKTI